MNERPSAGFSRWRLGNHHRAKERHYHGAASKPMPGWRRCQNSRGCILEPSKDLTIADDVEQPPKALVYFEREQSHVIILDKLSSTRLNQRLSV